MKFKSFHNPPANTYADANIAGLVQKVNLFLTNPTSHRILTFIAARRGEGTSTIAHEFAETLAKDTGHKVLLIDASPSLNSYWETMGHDSSFGVVDAIASGREPEGAIRNAGSNLQVARWLGNEQNREATTRLTGDVNFWNTQQQSFDTIVIDAPALQSSADGLSLAAKSDATILVVEAEATRQPVIENLRDTLTAAGAKIAGIVMNKRRFYIPEKVYAKM